MKRLAYIDVLRGIALLTVLFHHLPPAFGFLFGSLQEMGGRGVDLFFVLSGFLIGTTSLQRAAVPAGRVAPARAYWLLRISRIWPLYFLILAAFAAGVFFVRPEVTEVMRAIPLRYLSFTSNYVGQPTLELGVLWSLAIEEQFYLAIGVLVLFAGRRRPVLEGAFVGVALCAIATSLRYRLDIEKLYGFGILPKGDFIFMQFHSTLSRMDQLAIGILLAVFAPRFNALPFARSVRASRTTSWAAVAVGLAFLIYMPHLPVVGFTLVGLGFAAVVLWAQRPGSAHGRSTRWESLALRSVGAVGKLSFGMYLFHPIVRNWVESLFGAAHLTLVGHRHAVAFLGAWTLLTWALAAVSYRFLEEPILNWVRGRIRDVPAAPEAATGVLPKAA